MQQAPVGRRHQRTRFTPAVAGAAYVLSVAGVCAAAVQLALGGVSEVLVKWTPTVPFIAVPMLALAAVVALSSSSYGLLAGACWSGARISLFVLVAIAGLVSVSVTALLFSVYLLDAHQWEHVTVFLLALVIAAVPFVAAGVGIAQTARSRARTTARAVWVMALSIAAPAIQLLAILGARVLIVR